ncbi:CsbD family protein [Bdellovibrio sp. HCB290]|uniref:CsbD family protein n=1 Tax=Bdellovibrio sp. HCB290 TaxID=3394356 RepID=UPI0039B4E23A
MNKNTLGGDWKILKGKIKSTWGRFTDDEIETMQGDLTKLEGQLQKTYGMSQEEATKKYNEFKNSLSDPESDQSFGEERINRTSLDSDINPPKEERHH